MLLIRISNRTTCTKLSPVLLVVSHSSKFDLKNPKCIMPTQSYSAMACLIRLQVNPSLCTISLTFADDLSSSGTRRQESRFSLAFCEMNASCQLLGIDAYSATVYPMRCWSSEKDPFARKESHCLEYSLYLNPSIHGLS